MGIMSYILSSAARDTASDRQTIYSFRSTKACYHMWHVSSLAMTLVGKDIHLNSRISTSKSHNVPGWKTWDIYMWNISNTSTLTVKGRNKVQWCRIIWKCNYCVCVSHKRSCTFFSTRKQVYNPKSPYV